MLNVRTLILNRCILITIIFFLQGCGPAIHLSENYEAFPYESYNFGERTVYVGIDPTYRTIDSLPFYYSTQSTAPFSLSLSMQSKKYDEASLTLLFAQIELPGGELLNIVKENMEEACCLAEAPWNDVFTACKISIPLNNKLQFSEKYEFNVLVKFTISGSTAVGELRAKFRGIRSKERGTTFDIYMGV